MSRSRKKSPAGGNCGISEKKDKKIWHRRLRRTFRQRLGEDDLYVDVREVSDPWDMSKDGKQWWDNPGPKWKSLWDKWMRK